MRVIENNDRSKREPQSPKHLYIAQAKNGAWPSAWRLFALQEFTEVCNRLSEALIEGNPGCPVEYLLR